MPWTEKRVLCRKSGKMIYINGGISIRDLNIYLQESLLYGNSLLVYLIDLSSWAPHSHIYVIGRQTLVLHHLLYFFLIMHQRRSPFWTKQWGPLVLFKLMSYHLPLAVTSGVAPLFIDTSEWEQRGPTCLHPPRIDVRSVQSPELVIPFHPSE